MSTLIRPEGQNDHITPTVHAYTMITVLMQQRVLSDNLFSAEVFLFRGCYCSIKNFLENNSDHVEQAGPSFSSMMLGVTSNIWV